MHRQVVRAGKRIFTVAADVINEQGKLTPREISTYRKFRGSSMVVHCSLRITLDFTTTTTTIYKRGNGTLENSQNNVTPYAGRSGQVFF